MLQTLWTPNGADYARAFARHERLTAYDCEAVSIKASRRLECVKEHREILVTMPRPHVKKKRFPSRRRRSRRREEGFGNSPRDDDYIGRKVAVGLREVV